MNFTTTCFYRSLRTHRALAIGAAFFRLNVSFGLEHIFPGGPDFKYDGRSEEKGDAEPSGQFERERVIVATIRVIRSEEAGHEQEATWHGAVTKPEKKKRVSLPDHIGAIDVDGNVSKATDGSEKTKHDRDPKSGSSGAPPR